MIKNTRRFLLISLVLFLTGSFFVLLGSSLGGVEYLKNVNINHIFQEGEEIKNGEMVKKELDKFLNVDAEFDNANFLIKKSEDSKAYIEYFENKDNRVETSIDGYTLKIVSYNNARGFLNKFNIKIDINSIKDSILNGKKHEDNLITLYLPEGVYGEINLRSQYGFLDLENLDASTLIADNTYGAIKLENGNFKSARISNNMGSVKVFDSSFDKSSFELQMGNFDLNGTVVKEELNVESNMGNIEIDLKLEDDKNYHVDTRNNMGSVKVGDEFRRNAGSRETVKIRIENQMGSIKLKGH